ncbi:Response regulator receiver domain-containing protein [Oryzisolibacter propanilivorax]|uniref:Oxygen sensor histidine kinase NreB n=1 Tax=Oryzisolibacter propanilivorax TaxID=1527607 RepID=A0A1G9V364_9BURK|nr:ATP-binding protein [Oryzisolibacter propanilivorax]SDM66578.1 Response regulator receiver domain-containing protein [Oryzisolibacter propanilivorax]
MIPNPGTCESLKKPMLVLHLEDCDADHALVRRTLRRAGLVQDIQRVDTLADFADWLARAPFDVIVADYRLPGFTAIDAWNLAQARGAHPPFVLLTGAIGEAAAVEAMRLGFADYLLKDDLARLPHAIERAVEVAQARREREQAIAHLAESEQRLADLAEHLQTSIEEERAAIAREIHDDIGGALTAVKFDLAWITRHAPQGGLGEHAASAGEMLQHAIDASQRIMLNLRPPVLDQGLVAAVQWLAETFERRTQLPVRVSCDCRAIDTAPPALQLVAYRTAQEALTNIHKHAQASQVRIELSDHEGVLTVEVSDDGRGIAPEMLKKPRSFGLRGLAERARRAGGWLDVSSQPGRGTAIILSLPLRPEAAEAVDGGAAALPSQPPAAPGAP